MLTNKTSLPPFLSLHSIAAVRGDGLHPELLTLFKRRAAGLDDTSAEFAELRVGGELRSGQVRIERFITTERKKGISY